MSTTRTPVYQDPRDRGRWHVTISRGDVARSIRLPGNPLTAEAAEIEAQRLYELNGGTTVRWFGWARQLTGRPYIHHGYATLIEDKRQTKFCGHNHRFYRTALACGERLAHRMNSKVEKR